MTTVRRPNKDALIQALDIYRDAMRPFLVRHLRQVRGRRVGEVIRQALGGHQANQFEQNLQSGRTVEESIDVNDFPVLLTVYWQDIFSNQFHGDRVIRNRLHEIKAIRNEVSHPVAADFDDEKTRAHIYMIADALGKIGRTDAQAEVEQIRDELFATPLPEPTPTPEPEATPQLEPPGDAQGAFAQLPAPRAAGLRPWREVIHPNEDVTEGRFRQSEFAASLQRVYDGRARNSEYGVPVSFFNRTYITPGMRALLVNTVQRLTGAGGDPVIQTKTGFGGGKTHSLIALYYLVRHADLLISTPAGSDFSTNREINKILEAAGLEGDPSGLGEIAVLDGTHLSPTDSTKTETGAPRNTLWGEMAYQLAGQPGYDLVGEAARTGVAPGQAQLDALFDHVGPCVILIDELVAYWRNAVDSDSVYTFLQALTQSVSASDHVALVVTLPESAEEAGGERGQAALETLQRLFGRIEAVWEPLAVNEAFEVVRRRLFGEILDPMERDRTCEAFYRLYSGNNRRNFPSEAGEPAYLQRLKACYPVHPEIFDRLYSDWSSLAQFQRTRGVLRMLASCVSYLYRNDDANPLIMPANLPLRDPSFTAEFDRLLSENWAAVISEADSDGSRTDRMDAKPRYGQVGGAAKRVARTIFLGSAPTGALRGVEERQIRLGVTQPYDTAASYSEALQEMSKELHYLYSSNDRYYFHAEENLNKVAADRALEFPNVEVDRYITDLLNSEVRRRNAEVLVYADGAVIPDNSRGVRLVILPPDQAINSRASEANEAEAAAKEALLTTVNGGNRIHRNTVLFLATKRQEARNLRQAVRNFLAWQSMTQVRNGDDRRLAGLTGERAEQANTRLRNADEAVRAAVVNAYRWGLAPTQPDPQDATGIQFTEFRANPGSQGEIVNAALTRFITEEALVEKISPATLARLLQAGVWGSSAHGAHIEVDAWWEMLTSYVYLPRLRDRNVLQQCIAEGIAAGAFGYARGYNPDTDEYRGLRYEVPLHDPAQGMVINENSGGLLVSPDRAAEEKRREMERQTLPTAAPTPGSYPVNPPSVMDELSEATPDRPAKPRYIRASKTTPGDWSLDDFNSLRDEIIRNLREGGGEITITVTVEARNDAGFEETVIHAVRDNSSMLGIDLEADLTD